MVYVFLFNSTYLVLTVTAASHSTDTDAVKSLHTLVKKMYILAVFSPNGFYSFHFSVME